MMLLQLFYCVSSYTVPEAVYKSELNFSILISRELIGILGRTRSFLNYRFGQSIPACLHGKFLPPVLACQRLMSVYIAILLLVSLETRFDVRKIFYSYCIDVHCATQTVLHCSIRGVCQALFDIASGNVCCLPTGNGPLLKKRRYPRLNWNQSETTREGAPLELSTIPLGLSTSNSLEEVHYLSF
jgi:hypothetical protein